MRRAPSCLAGLAAVAAGCHVRVRTELSRPEVFERTPRLDGAVAQRPALVWTDAGRLRFVEPLECPTEERYRVHTTIETAVRPNLATVTVGVIAAAIGGVMLTSGLFSSHPGSSPYTSLGGAGLAIGLPLAIGPFVDTGVETEHVPAATPLRRPGTPQPCDARPLVARAATIATSGLSIHGAIAADGGFAISPYDWIDAFDLTGVPAAELVAAVAGGPTVTAVLDHGALVAHARAFLDHATFNATIRPVTLIPGLRAGAVTARLVDLATGPALRVTLPLANDGSGPAFAVRGQITAPGQPALDGRMLYIGQLAPGEATARALDIPLAPTAAAALRGQPLDLSIELRDAHGTAPSTALRFHGTP